MRRMGAIYNAYYTKRKMKQITCCNSSLKEFMRNSISVNSNVTLHDS